MFDTSLKMEWNADDFYIYFKLNTIEITNNWKHIFMILCKITNKMYDISRSGQKLRSSDLILEGNYYRRFYNLKIIFGNYYITLCIYQNNLISNWEKQ